ncbi:hypothetical protein UP09_28295 [Bradyrhizobium sp. LTSP885]|nr:hypothetical protein UP09_28295 [Bradyrhizobium sp. LTSP885]
MAEYPNDNLAAATDLVWTNVNTVLMWFNLYVPPEEEVSTCIGNFSLSLRDAVLLGIAVFIGDNDVSSYKL